MTGIYKITNKTNGKVYVGQAQDIFKRWRDHEKALVKHNHHNHKLQKAFDDSCDGIDNFEFEILEKCKMSELDALEVKYMKEYEVLDDNRGYNIRTEGIVSDSKIVKKKVTVKNNRVDDSLCDLSMYDKEYHDNVNSMTMVNMFDVLSMMLKSYNYIVRETTDFNIYEHCYSFSWDTVTETMPLMIKQLALGKDGAFKCTEFLSSPKRKPKVYDYKYHLSEDLFNNITNENIFGNQTKMVRLSEVIKMFWLYKKFYGIYYPFEFLMLIEVVGIKFLGKDYYKFIDLGDLPIDMVSEKWKSKKWWIDDSKYAQNNYKIIK